MNEPTPENYWSLTEGVFNCLIDAERSKVFGQAIRNTVQKGDIVVDMGAGTGILSLFAAQAGAKKVYAIEFDNRNVVTLQKTIEVNGFKDTIEILHGDVTKIDLPEVVDVVIGEMIATGLIEELQIPAMQNIRRFMHSTTRVVLREYISYIDLVSNKDEYYGFKFPIVRYEYSDEESLISDPLSLKEEYSRIDFLKNEMESGVNIDVNITIQKNGVLNGLRISSHTVLSDDSTLDGTFAYSYPIILPLTPCEVHRGDQFQVKLSYLYCKGFGNLEYSVVPLKNVL